MENNSEKNIDNLILNESPLTKQKPKKTKNKKKDFASLKCIEQLEEYLMYQYEVAVYRDREYTNEYFPSVKIIELKKYSLPRLELITLLHESGHVQSISDTNYHHDLPYMSKHFKTDPSKEKIPLTIAYGIDIIREEIRAWDNGWDIAKKLNFDKKCGLRKKNYYFNARKNLFTYVESIFFYKQENKKNYKTWHEFCLWQEREKKKQKNRQKREDLQRLRHFERAHLLI